MLYFGLILLFSFPFMQNMLASCASEYLSDLLDTEVHVGSVSPGLLNRLIIDDIDIKDQKGKDMLKIARTSASISVASLFHGQINISSSQLFGVKCVLYKKDEKSLPNYQFVLDAFKSDKKESKSSINLRINSFIMRHANLKYDVLDAEKTPERLNMNHLDLRNLAATISLKAFTPDSLNLSVKRLNITEKNSGLHIANFQTKIEANKRTALMSKLCLTMDDSRLNIDTLVAGYGFDKNNKFVVKSFSTGISETVLNTRDFRCLVPELNKVDARINVGCNIEGNNEHIRLKNVSVKTDNDEIAIILDASIDYYRSKHPFISADINNVDISSDGTEMLVKSLSVDENTAKILERLGDINFSGNVSAGMNTLYAKGKMVCDAGDLSMDCGIGKEKNLMGHISSDNLEIGEILDNDKLGNVSFDIDVDGRIADKTYPIGTIDGDLMLFEYAGYQYQNISLNANSDGENIGGKLNIDDENLKLNIDGLVRPTGNMPKAKIAVNVKDFNPNSLNLTQKFAGEKYAFNLTADLVGKNIDNVLGSISVDSIEVITPERRIVTDNIRITSRAVDRRNKHVTIASEFINADINGDFGYTDIVSSIQNRLSHHLPSLAKRKSRTHNNFAFDMTISDSEMFRHLTELPASMAENVVLKGVVDDASGNASIALLAPKVYYNNTLYDSISIICQDCSDSLDIGINLERINDKGQKTAFAISAYAKDDKLDAGFGWRNLDGIDMEGKIGAIAQFTDSLGKRKTSINLKKTQININDTLWQVHPSAVSIYGKEITCNGIMINHVDQHIKIDGKISDTPGDSLIADISKMQLEYILDLVNFHAVEFKGKASGRAIVSNFYNKPKADAYLLVDGFSLQGGVLGNAKLHGSWNEEIKGISITGQIDDIIEGRTTKVDGYVSPGNNDIDLLIGTNKTSAKFLNGFIGGIFSNIDGDIDGYLRVCGPLNEINLVGDIVPRINMTLNATNVTYHTLGDTIKLRPYSFRFDDIRLADKKNNTGIVNGEVKHRNLTDFSYRFRIDADNLTCYDERVFNEDKFYATVYADGQVNINGEDGKPLHINAYIKPQKGSVFAYDAATPDVMTNSSFITFRDRSSAPSVPNLISDDEKANEKTDSVISIPSEEYDTEYTGDIYINFNVDLTPETEIKMRMDNTQDGFISTYGNGVINAQYHNKGAFNMYGKYNITSGKYRLYLHDIVYRYLSIQNGSSVEFNGAPFDANIHLICWHTINSVPLSDLIGSTSYSQNNKTKVICIMDVSGKLGNTNINFDIDLPTVSEEEKQLVRSMISTEEEKNMQLLYLLGLGRFYTYDYARADNSGNSSSQAMSSLLSSTLSGQINQMLSSIIGSESNWNFGTSLTTGEKGWEDMDIEGVLSGRLLNDRLLINGNFGYRDNTFNQKSTNFVGDFDIRWRLKENGNTYLRAYNQTNDRYFTKATLTTQGIGFSYQKDFESFMELFTFKRRMSKKISEQKTETKTNDK